MFRSVCFSIPTKQLLKNARKKRKKEEAKRNTQKTKFSFKIHETVQRCLEVRVLFIHLLWEEKRALAFKIIRAYVRALPGSPTVKSENIHLFFV